MGMFENSLVYVATTMIDIKNIARKPYLYTTPPLRSASIDKTTVAAKKADFEKETTRINKTSKTAGAVYISGRGFKIRKIRESPAKSPK